MSHRGSAQTQPSAVLEAQPSEAILAVVVITRNEAEHIRDCLDSVAGIATDFADAPTVLVDSDSTDETIAIAKLFPVTIYRYRAAVLSAAAGRRIGFQKVQARYVLFVDGDCCIEPEWVKRAVGVMESSPSVAVISGRRREVPKRGCPLTWSETRPPSVEYGIGGNALYRSEVLHKVGNFNPFLPALEEMELQGRIQAAGYQLVITPEVMFTHYTYPNESLPYLKHLWCSGRTRAVGQLLRLAVEQGRLGFYMLRFNRYLLVLAYLLALGLCAYLDGLLGVAVWIELGGIAFLWLVLQRRSVNSAAYLVALWLTGALGIVYAIWKNVPAPELFTPQVDKIT